MVIGASGLEHAPKYQRPAQLWPHGAARSTLNHAGLQRSYMGILRHPPVRGCG